MSHLERPKGAQQKKSAIEVHRAILRGIDLTMPENYWFVFNADYSDFGLIAATLIYSTSANIASGRGVPLTLGTFDDFAKYGGLTSDPTASYGATGSFPIDEGNSIIAQGDSLVLSKGKGQANGGLVNLQVTYVKI